MLAITKKSNRALGGLLLRRLLHSHANKNIASPQDHFRLTQLISAYKSHGHLIANIDPLGLAADDPLRAPYLLQDVPVLKPEYYGLHVKDDNTKFWINDCLSPVLPGPEESLTNILQALRKVFCGPIGTQYTHVVNPEAFKWLHTRVLEHALHEFPSNEKLKIHDSLTRAMLFEEFCGKRLSGAKRFSLEGSEALIPGLECLFARASEKGIDTIEMGMPHRGRLNMLINVLQVPMEGLLYRFQPYLPDDNEHPNNSDDVRYHLGTSVLRPDGLRISLAANPSHLESVNSVVLGKTRARQFLMRGTIVEDDSGVTHVVNSPKRGSVDYSPSDYAKKESMALLLHGDASFFQGSVREVLGFSNLRDYTTGGTVHLIVNNQIGFTTTPKESHSSIYCSDVALSNGSPIFHVNGDSPEAVALVCRTAVDYRQEFGRDCVVNIWCYRRHGHNEMDDPGLTQPLMYKRIAKLPKLPDKYATKLWHEGIIDDWGTVEAQRENICESYRRSLAVTQDKSDTSTPAKLQSLWNELGLLRTDGLGSPAKRQHLLDTSGTGVDVELLRSFGRAIFTLPKQFKAHPKVRQIYEQRLSSIHDVNQGKTIRWATAEALAFASLLADGFHIRLSGQDVERGTFNQRHAVIYDQERAARGNEEYYKPWTALQQLDWHQEDVRQDLVRRASKHAIAEKAEEEEEAEEGGFVGHYSFPSIREGSEESSMYSTQYVGHYEFPSSTSKKNLKPRSNPNEDDPPLIKGKLERMKRRIDSRAQQLRDSRKFLRWREPGKYRRELGEMEVCNSPLSEEAVLGFEHGYSLYSPMIMPIWEAQFGDFSNCAQVVIDTFIASGEEKWVRSSGVVILLPHGYDGQGPDHSSARPERFLQLCSESDRPHVFPTSQSLETDALVSANMHILNLTTPAQYFHALRRQMVLPIRKPLIILTPKYLLHHKPCSSDLEEFGPKSSFQTVFDDENVGSKRVLLCSGKMYYHLANKRKALGLGTEVALVRIEQLCPFPFFSLRKALEKRSSSSDVEIYYVQEEPKNMGAWTYVEPRIRHVLERCDGSSRVGVTYCGRPPSATAATGSFELHRTEMNQLLNQAFDGIDST